ncbi:molybdopterin oxidoreductase family protein [Thermoactinomyces sp. CICC 10522]|uniref:molybdopterin oxidoreductase family protein n=1 Tax=Thermoactinomyces sp. CICC 10522 TaxID=2767427 RepID=UPI0018DBE955|nr:nitrate reductase [Thermoactinomyces sp. CICC 10522]MBH8605882.1 nitrate reductase [Thermoactinomyces sp. CICC 10522]
MVWETSREDINIYSQGSVDKFVYSTCNICSNGCGCFIAVKNNKIVGIKGNVNYPVNRGRLGPKGENQWYANNSIDRLTSPLIRNAKGKLVPASWDEAMGLIVDRVKSQLQKNGPDSLAFYHTGQAYLEEYYTIAKITRAGLRTHHVDANTRLCTATAQWALIQSFGADGPPASIEDMDQAEVIVYLGRNSNETNTVLWERTLDARERNGSKIIEIDPRADVSTRFADLRLRPKSGTNVAVLNGIIHLLIRNNWIDLDFIEAHTVGYSELRRTVEKYDPRLVERITGVPANDLITAATWIGTSRKTVTCLLQGVYQSMDATAAATLVNSMHLIMGKIGKPGCGPFQHAGQPSSMSNREVGGTGFYPGYRNSENPRHLKEIADLWNVDVHLLPVGPQTHIMNMLDLIEKEQIRFMWVMGTNPVVSLPNRTRVIDLLKRVFLIVQDPFLSETAQLADVVLPTAMWGEKEGTMTNLERRVNVLRKAVDPPFGLPSDFEIWLDFARRMDFRDKDGNPLIQYRTPEECFNEWRIVSKGRPCDMSGMTYDKMEKLGGIQWPCNEEHPNGTIRLYSDFHFHTEVDDAESYGHDLLTGRSRTREEFIKLNANGRAILYAADWAPPPEMPDRDYPFYLNTGRIVYHWHTRTKTGRAPLLHMAAPEAYVEIHPKDAKALEIRPADPVRVETRRGSIVVPARITDTVLEGSVFVPFHYGSLEENQAANELTLDVWDPVSKQPLFKNAACKVEKATGFPSFCDEKSFLSDLVCTPARAHILPFLKGNDMVSLLATIVKITRQAIRIIDKTMERSKFQKNPLALRLRLLLEELVKTGRNIIKSRGIEPVKKIKEGLSILFRDITEAQEMFTMLKRTLPGDGTSPAVQAISHQMGTLKTLFISLVPEIVQKFGYWETRFIITPTYESLLIGKR